MDYQLNTRLNGNIAMTSSYHERASLQRDKTLYKFIWVQIGTLTLEIDHIPCLLYTSPSPRDRQKSRMPSSA